MSKKIIYLLSLLMALSLVFASCKKNSVTDALGGQDGPPSTGGNDGSADQSTGLYEKSDDMPNEDEFIRRDKLFNGEVGGNYHRNPVIVAGRDGAVFIFVEKRWERAGAANDVGVDGQGKVDIVYLTSKNSGIDKFNNSAVTTVGTPAKTAADSHGAPVVYYIKDSGTDPKQDKIVIVASAGSGIGRTTSEVLASTPSKIEYIVGSFTDKTTISWGAWTKIETPDLSTEVPKIQTGDNGYNSGTQYMGQWGTHAEKGLIDNQGNLILPVILAQQGTSAAGKAKELMGVYVLEGQLSDSTVNWKEATAGAIKVGYKGTKAPQQQNLELGQWKESHIAPTQVNGSAYDVLVIPSPQGGRQNNNILGKHTGNGTVEASTGLPASEGSFGYLLTDKWFGANSYTANLQTGELTGTTKQTRIVYSHVQSQASKLTLYVLDESRQKLGSFELGATGKSSSVDMLPDGSIVIAAENTKDGNGYFLYFDRRSQAQIARLGNVK